MNRTHATMLSLALAFLPRLATTSQTHAPAPGRTSVKIYTLRDPETGATFDFKLDHYPSYGESLELISSEKDRRYDLDIRQLELSEQIDSEPQIVDHAGHLFFPDTRAGLQSALQVAQGEIESIPEAFIARAPRPLSVIPVASDFWEPGDAYTTRVTQAEWFRKAGEHVGFGYLVALLSAAYGLSLLLVRLVPASPLARGSRWFFSIPVIRPPPLWMTARNWVRWAAAASGPGGVCAVLLFLCAAWTWPSDFYTITRVIVCTTAFVSALAANAKHQRKWIWLMTVTALLFNPLLPLHLQPSTWRALDGLSALEFVFWLIANSRTRQGAAH